ncbi:MAG: DMT family transporter [Oscillibacter sp.]|nr:DMT family transporter [Oscillibacter sp.]
MQRGQMRQNLYAVLAALIWGTAFVAQSVGADFVPPLAFNAARSFIAFFALLALCLLRRRARRAEASPASRRELLTGGLCCGAALGFATFLQQTGLATTSAGKAGFLTAMYIVIVPIFSLFLKKRIPRLVWLGVLFAVAGLYCLCVKEGFSVERGDLCVAACAFVFAIHILVVDRFTQRTDAAELSCVQFLVMALFSLAASLLTHEGAAWSGLLAAIGPLLYLGVFSSGVAYTLQILAQRDSNPAVISLLMSLEAVFATVAGALILGEAMSGREYLGCALMLVAVILAQLPEKGSAPKE